VLEFLFLTARLQFHKTYLFLYIFLILQVYVNCIFKILCLCDRLLFIRQSHEFSADGHFTVNFWGYFDLPYELFNFQSDIEISNIDWILSRRACGRLLDHPVYLYFQLNRLLCTLLQSLLAGRGKGRRSVGLHVIQVNIRGIRTSSHPSSFVYSVPLYPALRRSSSYLVSSKSFNEKDLGFTRH